MTYLGFKYTSCWDFPGSPVSGSSVMWPGHTIFVTNNIILAHLHSNIHLWVGKIPWRSGNPLQYSCLENPMDRGAWWATVHGATESWHNWGVCTHHTVPVFIVPDHGGSLEVLWKGEFKSESRSVVSYSLRHHGLYSPWNSPGQNTGVGTCSLLQGIFPTQGSKPGLLHCRQILYQLSHQGCLSCAGH